MDSLKKLENVMSEMKKKLSITPTGKLWIQLLELFDLLKLSKRAQRTGECLLYFLCLQLESPFFASCGHNPYTKSINLFLNDMMNLKGSDPDIYENKSQYNYTQAFDIFNQ